MKKLTDFEFPSEINYDISTIEDEELEKARAAKRINDMRRRSIIRINVVCGSVILFIALIFVIIYLISKFPSISPKLAEQYTFALNGDSSVLKAAKSGNFEKLESLSIKNADINKANSKGETPLSYAFYTENLELLTKLKEIGISLDTPIIDKTTSMSDSEMEYRPSVLIAAKLEKRILLYSHINLKHHETP